VFGVPGAVAMAIWSFAARFGYTMTNVALLLFVQSRTGSYGIAGALSAASLVGTAAGTVWQGRLVDRYGPTRPLLGLTLLYAASSTAVIAGITADLPPPVLAIAIAVQCGVLPAVAVASRTMWSRLIPAGDLRQVAYSYEAISFELCWLLGPAVSGLLATLVWSGAGLVASVVLASAGAVGFALTRAVRPVRALAPPDASTPAGVENTRVRVDRGGLATLLLAAAGFGWAIGSVVVGVIAGTAAAGVPRLVGPLLAMWSVISIVGGLVFQRWPWPRNRVARLPVQLTVLGAVLVLPVLVDGVGALVATMVVAGLTLVPQITTHNAVLDGLVPPARLTEAYGLVTTSIAVANAGGQASAGILIDRYGHRAGFVGALACVLAIALAVWARRRRLIGGVGD
jgi:MFS family permease